MHHVVLNPIQYYAKIQFTGDLIYETILMAVYKKMMTDSPVPTILF